MASPSLNLLSYGLSTLYSSCCPLPLLYLSSPTVLTLARYPSRFTPLRLYPHLSSSVASEAYIHPYAFVS